MSKLLNELDTFQPGNAANNEIPSARDEQAPRQQTLRECVKSSLAAYLEKVDPENITDLYELVLSEVEAPLLETVLQHTRSNQSRASSMLGLNRGTLRKKLKKYGMLN